MSSSLEGFPLDEGQRARWMVARAGVLEAMGRSEESLEVFQALMQRYPSLPSLDGKVLLTIAGLYLQEGDQGRAQQLLDQLRASEPPPACIVRIAGSALRACLSVASSARRRLNSSGSATCRGQDHLLLPV